MFRIAVCDCEDIPESVREATNNMMGSVLDKIKCEISYFTCGKDLIASLKSESPYQLVFVPERLRDMSGLSAVTALKKITPEVEVIYILPNSEAVSEEFGKLNFDCFIKPVSPSKLRNAFSRRLSERFCVFDGYLNVCFQRSMKQIPLHRVYYFERDKRRIVAQMKGDENSFCGKLENIEKPLADNGFVRCHKSFIVNTDTVIKLDGNKLFLPGGREITVSISCYDDVCEALRKKKIPIAGSLKK